MRAEIAAVERTIATLTSRLLDSRNSAGHWEGHLSSSALSTATACIALMLAGRESKSLAQAGLAWLVANQNPDGGWGDTVISVSNVSTTALCWAALSMGRSSHRAIERAEAWLRADAGDSLDSAGATPVDSARDRLAEGQLRETILKRYGKDRTFSVPILTVLALAGKLGRGAEAWRRVPQLPFELAACPHRWFQWLRLPVVSYAVPALVAMGQARHRHAPSRNPLLRWARGALRPRTLAKLRAMQPTSGGYLEATPLTAFVTMSLITAGEAEHPVVRDGLRFLAASARADGSWPIDTNLATWVTTWSIKTLSGASPERAGPQMERRVADKGLGLQGMEQGFSPPVVGQGFSPGLPLIDWLLGQQSRHEHPYTHAAPGAWAWTDLPGGVPDADDTAGALLALGQLAPADPRAQAAAGAGIAWLLDVQNRDGGIPTFCKGWGALPFDRSAPDLTAHALEAWSVWHAQVSNPLRRRIERAVPRAVDYLVRSQETAGSWSPLWFGNQHVSGDVNFTYGTSQVLSALGSKLVRGSTAAQASRVRGLAWLLSAQNGDGGWGGAAGAPSSIEETGVALHAVAMSASVARTTTPEALHRGAQWIVDATHEGRKTPASPIGLYFARLWYSEELYPLIFGLRGLLEARAHL